VVDNVGVTRRAWGRRERRTRVQMWTIGTSVVVLSIGSVIYALAVPGANSSVNVITVLCFPLTIIGLIIGGVSLRPPDGEIAEQAQKWATQLAVQVKESEERSWRQLLGDDIRGVNLEFVLRETPGRSAQAPAHTGRLFEKGATVPDVGDFYRRTRPRRLVITGAAGSGKTVLAVGLILDLLENRESGDPIPLRMSLAEWNTEEPLDNWVERQLVDVYEWSAGKAAELVRQRRVLPILDGLDEMDSTGPNGDPRAEAPRAWAALKALNRFQDGREAAPVVLTCRTSHYEVLARHLRLYDAARVEISPVSGADANLYLAERAHDAARWRPVLDALERDPHGTLASVLSTPWRLCLAATVYATDGDPTELLLLQTPRDVDEHLLARLIPATILPVSGRKARYRRADVHNWLGRFATYLGSSVSTGGTDLVLHHLWPMFGSRWIRVMDFFLTAILALLPLSLLLYDENPGSGILPTITMILWASFNAARRGTGSPVRTNWRRMRTRAGLRRAGSGFLQGGALGVLLFLLLLGPYGVLYDLTIEPDERASGLGRLWQDVVLFWKNIDLVYSNFTMAGPLVAAVVFVVGFGLLLALGDGIGGEPDGATNPRGLIRGDIRYRLVTCVPYALVFGLMADFLSDLIELLVSSDLTDNDSSALALVDIATALIISGTGAAFRNSGASRRYFVFVLCSRGRLPWRPGVFLDWACSAGLMRLSGGVYQFRHREFQQWLQRNPLAP
jgi:NACHT domain